MPEIMKIANYPDPVLRRRAHEVEDVDSALRDAVLRMAETMRVCKGVGLAAPQVGIDKRIVVFSPSTEKTEQQVLINPVIVDHRGAMEGEEGCLSFPGIFGTVRRSAHVVVAGYDLEGKEVEISGTDFLARVLQHEIDHLEGMLLLDRMTPESRILARDMLKALEDAFGAEEAEAEERH